MVASWEPLIGEEFMKPYMMELYKAIEVYKNSFFTGFKSPKDYFEVFKRTPMERVKVVFVIDTPDFKPDYLVDIERELRDGLDVNLICNPDYWWLHDQGIMFFPRYLSRDNNGVHKEWLNFTDAVLMKITERPVLVVTSSSDVRCMLKEFRSSKVISENKPWKQIDDWLLENNQQTNWSPL